MKGIMIMADFDWIHSYPHCVTVCDTEGIIIAMNETSVEHFKKYGGEKLIGSSLFSCHPESANVLIREQLANQSASTYMTASKEKKRLISQVPWYSGTTFGGMVETVIELPDDMPVKKR